MIADRSIPADCIRIHLLQQTRESLDKILQVRVTFKYRFAFDPSNDHMMQDAGGIYASPARHVIEIRYPPKVVNVETTSLFARYIFLQKPHRRVSGLLRRIHCSLKCARHLQAESHRESLDKILLVRVIFKYRFAFDPSNDDVMQGAGGVNAISAKQI